jgi:hypothetical protein
MYPIRLAAVALLASLTGPAPASVLYKSVSPSGVIEFSDIPPGNDRIAERIVMPGSDSSSGAPSIAMGSWSEDKMREMDDSIQRASALVDMAEHEFAVARRFIWTLPDLRLKAATITRSDIERVEFYKRSVLAARQVLMEVLAQKRRATVPDIQTAMR